MLEEGGIIILSTHGMYCYNLLDQQTKRNIETINEGFYYLFQSETKRLCLKDYGTAYVNYVFVEKIVNQHNLGKIVSYYPQKLWNFQDIYIIQKIAKT
jgi:hypothetical protein